MYLILDCYVEVLKSAISNAWCVGVVSVGDAKRGLARSALLWKQPYQTHRGSFETLIPATDDNGR